MRRIDFDELSEFTTQPRGLKDNIVLHWSGCGTYDDVFNHYHVNITGNGDIYVDGLADDRSHTWMRNEKAIGISASCMGGDTLVWADGTIAKWGDYPPKDIQVDVMAKVAAKICYEVGIDVSRVLTHHEIAEIDGYGIYNQSVDNKDIRWDLLGYGDSIRAKARKWIAKWKKEQENA